MICSECGTEPNEQLLAVLDKYRVPFRCSTCKSLKFPYKALNGVVYVWPKIIEETQGLVIIPEIVRENFKHSIGVVLSSGKGCRRKNINEFVKSELVPGDTILYDKTIPWRSEIMGSDEKLHSVDVMNILDIHATVTED